MATGESILKKMREYEARVLTALGFEHEPVMLYGVDLEEESVTIAWFDAKPPPEPPNGRWALVYLGGGEAARYKVDAPCLAPEVWDAILEARREWESNFPTQTPMKGQVFHA